MWLGPRFFFCHRFPAHISYIPQNALEVIFIQVVWILAVCKKKLAHSRHHDVPLVLLAVLAPVVVLGDDEPAAAASVLPNRLSCAAVEGG